MVEAAGVRVPPQEAEATRRRLAQEGTLRSDLHVLRVDGDIVFPVAGEGPIFDFDARQQRARGYQELLPWTPAEREAAPRAFDPMGDIAIVKVPKDLWPRRFDIGEALRAFLACRAVFHDHGVKGTFRVRDLERIAGEGGSETTVSENGLRLSVDVGAAYYSPRLADERARVAALVVPGERFVDLFGGCAPMALQAARAGAKVTTIDLNPVAIEYARRNAADNRITIDAVCGDARDVAAALPAASVDRILMNLPHGARDFLDVAARLAAPEGWVHYHEIMEDADLDDAQADILAAFAAAGRVAHVENVRHVRNYSASASHYAIDLRIE